MKKVFIILGILFLTGCTRTPVIEELAAPIVEPVVPIEEPVTPEITIGPNGFPLIQLTPAAQELVLEDFDYLAEIILANTPAQVIAPQRFGISIAEMLVEIRNSIINFEPVETRHAAIMYSEWSPHRASEIPTDDSELAAHYLVSLLLEFSLNINWLGHLSPRDFAIYWEQLEHAVALAHQSEIIDGRLMHNGEFGSDVRLAQHRFDAFTNPATLQFFGVDMADLNIYRELSDIGAREVGNITTELIEDGHIAYFRINSFNNNPRFDSDILFSFFAEIQDFNHLIIDLRDNMGGWSHYFPEYIVAALIDEPVVAYKNEFFMGSDLSRRVAEYSLAYWFGSAEEILLASDFISQNDFPYFDKTHLDFLTYVIPWQMKIEPRENNIPFNGKIWLLVNEQSASASESAAIIASSSGFATVVGRNTFGVTGTMHTYVSLPNTGILFRIDISYTIDAQGRQLEQFGITPDIYVPDGDILRYVLELIADW